MNFPQLSLLISITVLISGAVAVAVAAADTTFDNFVKCLSSNSTPSGIVYSPTNASFTAVLQEYVKNRRFNTSSTPKPVIIVTPETEAHVQAVVICAKSIGIHIKTRSGGHDYEGISYSSIGADPFILLDMSNFRAISIDIPAQTAVVQVGALLGELYYRIWEKSKVHAFPAGVCPTVGVGGHLSGGGYGNLIRKYGLTVDHVIDARIVDVNGKILDKKAMGEDLFWAIRGGGGGSFGVILSYTINLVSVPETVTVFRIMKNREENATDLVFKWQSVMATIDNDLFIRVLLQPVTGSQKGTNTIRASFIAMFLGDANRLVNIMTKSFPELGLKKSDCFEMSWIKSALYWANFDNKTSENILLDRHLGNVNFGKRKSDYVQTPISKEGLNSIFDKMVQLGKPGFVFNPYGGKMNEIAATATPMPHRAGNLYKIQYSVNWNDVGAAVENDYLNQCKDLYSFMTPFVSKSPRGAYLNYRDLDIGVNSHGKNSYNEGEVYGRKYFNGNFDRLVKVKTAVDPENFFRNEQSIPALKAKIGRKL